MGLISNPILRGGFPDPSICRVGEEYFLVNSSFEYFPGLPIHRSIDLVNWSWVGYALSRPEQASGAVNLVDVKSQDGIQAPSLRYHDGMFYIISTCVYRPPESDEGTCTNFVVTAKDASGPWSDPIVVAGAPGIDPDIFFDDDGKAWYVGTHPPHEKPNFAGEGEIWLQELDLESLQLRGERHYLWRGACHGGVFVEGPHIYKHEGMYYLIVAEGGTGVNHAVMVAASDKVTGPYFPNERNPMLTSRNLSYNNWVHSTGHADLFQTADGRWFMVLLGIRGEVGPSGDRRSNMGRETFLVPVEWEREPMEWSPLGPHRKHLWPVAAPLTGRVERAIEAPFPGFSQGDGFGGPSRPFVCEGFGGDALGAEWNFRRVPKADALTLRDRPGFLRLFAGDEAFAPRARCGFVGVRQRETHFVFQARMEPCQHGEGFEAGIALFQDDDCYITLLLTGSGEVWEVQLAVAERGGKPLIAASVMCAGRPKKVQLGAEAGEEGYSFTCSLDGGPVRQCGTANLDSIVSKGYTGAYLGLYCTIDHRKPANAGDQVQRAWADFDQVEHRPLPRE